MNLVERIESICPKCKNRNSLHYFKEGNLVSKDEECDHIECLKCGSYFAIHMTKDGEPEPLTDGKGLEEFMNKFIE
jgi:Zn ribbon nucleic-acid-binding protein